jgi:hypothetical protein
MAERPGRVLGPERSAEGHDWALCPPPAHPPTAINAKVAGKHALTW